MKLLLYLAILAAVWLYPVEGTDVGRLIPVEVIAVSESGGIITVDTDTGDRGEGMTLQEAFEDLEDTAPGVIYLDTAEYLLLEEGMEGHMDMLRRQLKGNVRLCHGREGIPLDGIADFLSVHRSDVKLNAVSDLRQIPVITEENGRYQLIKK